MCQSGFVCTRFIFYLNVDPVVGIGFLLFKYFHSRLAMDYLLRRFYVIMKPALRSSLCSIINTCIGFNRNVLTAIHLMLNYNAPRTCNIASIVIKPRYSFSQRSDHMQHIINRVCVKCSRADNKTDLMRILE